MTRAIRRDLIQAVADAVRRDGELARLFRISPRDAIAQMPTIAPSDATLLISFSSELQSRIRIREQLDSLDDSSCLTLANLLGAALLRGLSAATLKRDWPDMLQRCVGLSVLQRAQLLQLREDIGFVLSEYGRRRARNAPLLGTQALAAIGIDDAVIRRIVAQLNDSPAWWQLLRVKPSDAFKAARGNTRIQRQAIEGHARTVAAAIELNSSFVGISPRVDRVVWELRDLPFHTLERLRNTSINDVRGLSGDAQTTLDKILSRPSRVIFAPPSSGDPIHAPLPYGTFLGLLWRQPELLTVYKPQTADAPSRFCSGKVNDVLVLTNGELAAATDSGGIWWLENERGNYFASEAFPVSNWSDSASVCNVFSLCRGNDDSAKSVHLFASTPVALREGRGRSLLAVAWQDVAVPQTPPLNIGKIGTVLVDADYGRIFLASTNFGVVWAAIPPAQIGPTRLFNWQPIAGMPSEMARSLALAPTPTGPRLVASYSAGQIFLCDTTPFGVGPARAALINPFPGSKTIRSVIRLGTVTVTAVVGAESRLYATFADASDNTLVAVFRSVDAGSTWDPATVPYSLQLGKAAGSIAAASLGNGRETVAVGFVTCSLWDGTGSIQGAASWKALGPAVHDDTHALHFRSVPGNLPELYVAGDGGVTMTPDLGLTWPAALSGRLQDIQFGSYPGFRGGTWSVNFGATFDVSPVLPGVVVGGTQDNGVICANSADAGSAWFEVSGGDGQDALFLSDGSAIYWINPDFVPHITAFENIRDHVRQDEVIPGLGTGFPRRPRMTTVPVGANVVFAVAGGGLVQNQNDPDTLIFDTGHLFALIPYANAVGYAWISMASLDGVLGLDGTVSVQAIAAVSNTDVLIVVASSNGTRFIVMSFTLPIPAGNAVRSPQTQFREVFVPNATPPVGFSVNSIATGRGKAFMLANGNPGAVLEYDGTNTLKVLPVTTGAETLYGIAYDYRNDVVFVATDSTVYRRSSSGTWLVAADGLPSNPHCSGLKYVVETENGHEIARLYLATAGRSVWIAEIEQVF